MNFNNLNAQNVPTVNELNSYLKNQKFLVSYREGGVVYGTYYFLEIHYCPNGTYGLYGRSIKKTVLDNEQRNNWKEFGAWKVVSNRNLTGIQYVTNKGLQNFVPIYKLSDGSYYISEGISITRQGLASCL